MNGERRENEAAKGVARAVSTWRRRAALSAAARVAGRDGALAAFGAGSVLLLLRLLGDGGWAWELVSSPGWALGFALAVTLLAAAFGARRGWRSAPDAQRAAAALDLAAGGGGYVLAAFESGDARWQAKGERVLGAASRPRTSPAGAPLAALAGGLGFLLLAALVPVTALGEAQQGPGFERHLERLARSLAALEESGAVDAEQLDAWRERLGRLAERELERRGRAGLEGALEALDRLGDELSRAALEQRERGRDALDAARRLEAVAETLARELGRDPARAEALAQAAARAAAELAERLGAREDLASLAQRAAELASGLASSADGDAASRASSLSEELRARLEAHLERLAEAGLLDGASLAEFAGGALDAGAFERLAESLASGGSGGSGAGHLCEACVARAKAEARRRARANDGEGEEAECEDGECAEGLCEDGECEGGECEHGECSGGACSGGGGSGAGVFGISRGGAGAPLTFGEGEAPVELGAARALPRSGAPPTGGGERLDFQGPASEARGEAVGPDAVLGESLEDLGRRRLSPQRRAALGRFFAADAPADGGPR